MEKWSLKAIRTNMEMSQAEFAKAIGMPVTTYQRREAEPKLLTLYEAKKIAEFSGVDLKDIKVEG